MLPVDGGTDVCDQKNVLHWEQVNPPWVLPNYIGELAQALQVTMAWIATGGVATSTTMATNVPTPLDNASDGESEVPGSEDTPQETLPTLHWLLPKVLQLDQVEHTLDKGAWAAMPATHQGWKIFIMVSHSCFSSSPHLSSVSRAN